MKTRTIHRPGDFVSREIRLGGATPPRRDTSRAGRVAQDHVVYGQPRISPERLTAGKVFGEAVRRAEQHAAAERRAEAMQAARAEIRRARYVTVEQREDVMRIMIERGLSISEAYDAYVEDGDPSPRAGGKSFSVAR